MSIHEHRRACPLCEAICGLSIETDGKQVISIKGDKEDPFSRGHICPKAVGLKDIQEDPDRLRQPMKKVSGQFVPISWEEAIELACDGLAKVIERDGGQAIGVYQGNPNVHNWGMMTHASNFLSLLKTRNRFSATSVDQLPQQLVAYWMYGHQLAITIPDVDHTDYWLILGGNPIASNGSLMTVPDVGNRIKALQARGGKMVVLDPRRTETAEIADEHHFIRPASDAALLFALVNTVMAEGLQKLDRLGPMTAGLELALEAIEPFQPEWVESLTGLSANTIRKIARDFAKADKAVCYGRMGACTQRHGSLAQWGVQLLNLVTGNLDRVGGSLMASPALDLINAPGSKPGGYGRWHSRVRGLPEALGEFSAAVMAEEILTPGDGQIKAMVTIAGNPVLSTPNGRQLDQALESLEFMVAIDFYLNETSRHADLILPTTAPLEHDHYDLIFNLFGVRNQAKYSEAVFKKPDGALHDWELFDRLASTMATKLGKAAKPGFPPTMMLDMGLQMGRYGAQSEYALSLAKLKDNPQGIDLGPLTASFPHSLKTENRTVQAAPPVLLSAVAQWVEQLSSDEEELDGSDSRAGASDSSAGASDSKASAADKRGESLTLLLIGRRHIRSNNSWMHNSQRLIKGKNRCTALINTRDAETLGISDGQDVVLTGRVGKICLPAEVSDAIMPGVVSVPHGWGHDRPGIQLQVAQTVPGVSCNDLTDDEWLDEVSGNAAVNGVPVNLSVSRPEAETVPG